MRYFKLIFFCFFSASLLSQQDSLPHIIVLGVAQDGGYPQAGCARDCCGDAWKHDSLAKNVVSLALVVPSENKWYLFEATPDLGEQLRLFRELTQNRFPLLPDGIFITHAHIGHYTGLMLLGREVMNAEAIPVYALPKMKTFLENNGPWNQLVKLKNIFLKELTPDVILKLSEQISVNTFTVPHREEFSETAGFNIITKSKNYLFIPDIDKWSKFRRISFEINKCDIAFLDATFYSAGELSYRNIKEVPHPYVTETMQLFKEQDKVTREKIHFIHFNHTNQLLRDKKLLDEIKEKGFNIAEQGKSY